MSSRDKILNTIKGNQPGQRPLPPLPGEPGYGAASPDEADGPIPPAVTAAANPSTGNGYPQAELASAAGSEVNASTNPGASTSVATEPTASTPTSAPEPTATTPAAILPASAPEPPPDPDAVVQKFITVLEAIGGNAYVVSGLSRIISLLHEEYPDARRIISGVAGLESFGESGQRYSDPHTLENVDLAVLSAHFGVAENGACWITEDRMIERALPFIAQNLVLVIRRKDVVANMHEAYKRIEQIESANGEYGFATFIAGPSKTADIEQSLVLGAHGPKSMTVFLLDEAMFDAGFF